MGSRQSTGAITNASIPGIGNCRWQLAQIGVASPLAIAYHPAAFKLRGACASCTAAFGGWISFFRRLLS